MITLNHALIAKLASVTQTLPLSLVEVIMMKSRMIDFREEMHVQEKYDTDIWKKYASLISMKKRPLYSFHYDIRIIDFYEKTRTLQLS